MCRLFATAQTAASANGDAVSKCEQCDQRWERSGQVNRDFVRGGLGWPKQKVAPRQEHLAPRVDRFTHRDQVTM